MPVDPTPTERELEILKVLWDRGEATVRAVYEEMSRHAPIVQNTVQAFLRTMEDKGLVTHRLEGRTFIYKPVLKPQDTKQKLVSRVLHRVFDGAIDQLVQSALSLRKPTDEELAKLEALIREARSGAAGAPTPTSSSRKKGRP
jgi:predicted transcriptional regulator